MSNILKCLNTYSKTLRHMVVRQHSKGLISENKRTQRQENDQSFFLYFSAQWLKHQRTLKWVIYRHVARSQSEYVYSCTVTSSLGNKNKMRHPFGGNCPSSLIRTHFNGAFIFSCSLSSGLSDIWICEHNSSLPVFPDCFHTHEASPAGDCKNKLHV